MIPHTPGPWWATKNASYWQIDAMREDGYVSNIGDACGSSCSAPEPGWSMELGEANAKLMAAAPDLLAACEFLVNAGPTSHDIGKAFTLAAAALAKAEGGAQ